MVLIKGRRFCGALFAILLVAGCGGGGGAGGDSGKTHVAVVVPEVKLNVTNPLASHAVSLVSHVNVDAAGLLRAGSYRVGSHTLALAHDTPFTLRASVPVNGSSALDLASGDATLSVMSAVTVDGIAAPKTLTLKNHTAAADVDVVGTLLSAVMSRLPKPDSGEGTEAAAEKLSESMAQLSVNSASFDMRTDAEAEVAGCKFHFTPGSQIVFKNVFYTDRNNFKGNCKISIGAHKLNATIGGGALTMDSLKFACDASALATNGSTLIDLVTSSPSSLTLSGCAVTRGQKSLTIPSAALAPKTFSLNVKGRDWRHAALLFSGSLKTGVANAKAAFGIPDFNATVDTLGLNLDDTRRRVTFENCRVTLAASDVNDLVLKHLPHSKTVKIDKELIHQTPWRYKNVSARSMDVSNISVSGLHLNAQNSATLSCSANARVTGTVEKEHPLGGLLHRNSSTGPDVHEWLATGILGGPASVHFSVVPGKTFADSKARAEVAFTLNKLDKATVDWTGVSTSIAGKAEGAVLRALVGALKKHITTKGVPLDTTVVAPLFKHPDPRLEMLVVKSLTIRPTGGGTEVVASGYIDLN